jgi:hypothetical protein
LAELLKRAETAETERNQLRARLKSIVAAVKAVGEDTA